MKNKSIKLWLLLTTLFSYITANAYDFECDGLYYDLSSLSNRTCRLTSGNSSYSGSLRIPESVNYEGLIFTVTEIDPNAFNSSITELTIPATITTIPRGTIRKCNLTKLSFQDGESPLQIDDYEEIRYEIHGPTFGQPLQYLYVGRTLTGHSSFSESSSLTEIIIGPYVTDMPHLSGCNKLESVFIPDNVINLKNEGLCKCLGLKNVYVGNGVSKIACGFFNSCTSLENVYLGNNVSEIQATAFIYCDRLTNLFIFSDKLAIIADNTSGGIENTLPNTISKIYVPKPSRYDNLLKDYYRDYLITINPTSNEYSGKAPIFSYTNNVEGSEVTFDSPDLNINVGEYNTNIDVNFKIGEWQSTAKVPANYSITPANLTIIASDASRQYGEENPEFTCSFFGFKNNETQDVLTKQPIIETTATATSNVGTYPIIPYGAEARNYSITYERGKLNVTKADQGIVWEQIFDDVHVGDIIELTAESSAGLPVKYTSTDESIAEIFSQSGKKFVEFLKAGNVSIRANQEGNENYNEADRVSKSIEVKAKSILVSSLTFDYTEWNGNDNSKFQITATVLPENATNKSLEWYSSDEEIASVDQNGLVTILMPGNCIISAKTLDGSNLTATCNIRALSGTNTIELDNNAKFDIYNINGIMIYESASSEVLNSLSPGFYIIIQNGNVHKIMIQ